ncbi:hypothetical protein Vi05172_g12191 [Venturia inaequalis]|nr:hypothetical protein Vi05172_g12191 [Venturia inaequalis]
MHFYTVALSLATLATAAPAGPVWNAASSTIASGLNSLLPGSSSAKPPAPNQPAWSAPPYPNQPVQPVQPQPAPYSLTGLLGSAPQPQPQPVSGQPYPTQPYPSQPYPNQPYPNQPYVPQQQQAGAVPLPAAKPADKSPFFQKDKGGLTLGSSLGTYHSGPDGTYVKGGS